MAKVNLRAKARFNINRATPAALRLISAFMSLPLISSLASANSFNFTEVPLNYTSVVTVANPNDIVIITLLVVIAFCEMIRTYSLMRSWLIGDDNYA